MSHVIIVTSHKSQEWDGGDSVITAGLLSLWPQLNDQKLIYSRDLEYQRVDEVVAGAKYIVHAGTPSWMTVENRPIWKAAMKHEKRIAMLGIGLALNYMSDMWYGAEEFINLRDSGLIDLIVCRDKPCYYWLHQKYGFPSDKIKVLPCPGFYLATPDRALTKNKIFFSLANVEETAHETQYTFERYYDKCAYVVEELTKSGASVSLVYQRALTEAFRDFLKNKFFEKDIHSFNSCEEFCDFVRSQEVYIGVRNHGALPCAGAGKPSLLLGTDYRQCLADEIPFISKIDISHARWQPREVLDWYAALEPENIAASLINYRAITRKRWQDTLEPIKSSIA